MTWSTVLVRLPRDLLYASVKQGDFMSAIKSLCRFCCLKTETSNDHVVQEVWPAETRLRNQAVPVTPACLGLSASVWTIWVPSSSSPVNKNDNRSCVSSCLCSLCQVTSCLPCRRGQRCSKSLYLCFCLTHTHAHTRYIITVYTHPTLNPSALICCSIIGFNIHLFTTNLWKPQIRWKSQNVFNSTARIINLRMDKRSLFFFVFLLTQHSW